MGKNNEYTKTERLEKIREIAKIHSGICISHEYVDAETKLSLICSEGHTFNKRAREILRQNEWCRKCSAIKLSKNQRMPYKTVKDAVEQRNGTILSTEESYLNNGGKIDIRCDKGHTFHMKWASLNIGGWCKLCGARRAGDKMSLNIEVPQKLAQNRGGKLLSTEYVNAHSNLLWECFAGHTFTASYQSVSGGNSTWCPKCSFLGSASERIVRLYCESILGFECLGSGREWLINDDGNRMRFDGFNERYGFAFEHHGSQHYKETKFYKGENLLKRQRDDLTKEKLAAEHGIKLLIVNQLFIKTDLNQLRSNIISFASANGIPMVPNAKDIFVDVNSVYKVNPMEKLRSICKDRGGTLISNVYEGHKSAIFAECKKHGIFQTKPDTLIRGNWCKFCYYERAGKKKKY